MPRITAATVAEHAEQQKQRVFDAAIALFLERGYAAVTLSDIAGRVGLARSSLYRYFSSKAEIIVIWFRTELEAQIAESTASMNREGTPLERITSWTDERLDYAGRPEHALATTIPQIEPDLAPSVREELRAGRQRLLAPLRNALAETGDVEASTTDAIAELINGLVLAAAQHEAPRGSPDRALRERLHRAVAALVEPV